MFFNVCKHKLVCPVFSFEGRMDENIRIRARVADFGPYIGMYNIRTHVPRCSSKAHLFFTKLKYSYFLRIENAKRKGGSRVFSPRNFQLFDRTRRTVIESFVKLHVGHLHSRLTRRVVIVYVSYYLQLRIVMRNNVEPNE